MKTTSRTEQLEAAITALDARVTRLEGGPLPAPTPTPIPAPLHVDTNVYPLKMPDVVAPGATVTIGTGPNTISLRLSSHIGAPDNSVAVIVGGRAVAGPLRVSAHSGMVGGQWFHIKGVFPGKELTIASGGEGVGVTHLWVNEVIKDLLPMYYNGPSVDSRGARTPNATAIWNNLALPTAWSTEGVVVAPAPAPPPVVPESIISGAIGAAGPLPAGTLQALVDAAGASLKLPAGTFVGTASVPRAMTISGAGKALTTVTASGIRPKFDKGVFVPTVPGVVFEDMTITGASIAAALGANAAGVRADAGMHFTIRRCEVTRNQNGVLSSGANTTIEDCDFHDNGAGAGGGGATHEIYLNAGTHLLKGSRFKAGVLATHAVKSRGVTTILDCALIGNPDPTGANGGAVLDVPNGGKLDVQRTSLTMPAGAANHNLLVYGADGLGNGAGPVTLIDMKLDAGGAEGIIQSVTPGVALTISGTHTGLPPVFRGWGTVTNTLTRLP